MTEQFATLVYGILNISTGEFRYVSAGHPGPVHLPYGADPVIFECPGSLIGLAEDEYDEHSIRRYLKPFFRFALLLRTPPTTVVRNSPSNRKTDIRI